MTLEALRCFCTVVEVQSFRIAAEQLARSQPAVSQQIKALERELGQSVLDRRQMRPTSFGDVLYRRGREILLSTDSLRDELADIDETWSRDLRVGTSDTTALYILPPYVRAFATRMPTTRLIIVSRSTDAVVEQVMNGGVDIGVVTLPCGVADVHEQPLWTLDLALAVPKSHEISNRKRLQINDLKDIPYLALHRDTRTGRLIHEFFEAQDFEPQVVLDSGSFEVIRRYVEAGLGVSILPERFIGPADSVKSVRLSRLPRLRIGAIWRRGSYTSRAMREFLALLESDEPSSSGIAVRD